MPIFQPRALPAPQGMYNPVNEHDACGVGFVAHIKGRKSHEIVQYGLRILLNLDHRGATGADTLFGDGAGMLLQIPDALLREEMAVAPQAMASISATGMPSALPVVCMPSLRAL